MYCKCSNKENYEVISLCDVKKFSDKNGPFNNKAWIQISVADILMLDCNKYAIEKIEKVYIDITITDTKIIHTPISQSPNSEGMTLTGKKLLIDGVICSKIVYTSLTKEQSVYTSNFNIPFCTYIVIEERTDLFNDKYCVKTCIEDVFLSLIDCKTIFQNVTLFLLAEKTSFTCPSPQLQKDNDCTIISESMFPINKFFPDTININSVTNSPVTSIKFNIVDKTLNATSLATLPDNSNEYNYVGVRLYASKDTILANAITTATLISNINSPAFSDTINGASFDFDYILKLNYSAKAMQHISITNFQQQGTTYTPTSSIEYFKITAKGLVTYNPIIQASSTAFIVKTLDTDKEMIMVDFDVNNKKIVVTSTGASYNGQSSIPVFTLELKNNDGTVTKKSSSINGNENGDKFRTDLNDTNFEIGDMIELSFEDSSKVNLINYPNREDVYNMPLNSKSKNFIITNEGLVNSNLSNTSFNFKKNSSVNVSQIKFNVLEKKIIVLSSGEMANANVNENFFVIELKDSNGNIKQQVSINTDENANNLQAIFNNKSFEYNDIITLKCNYIRVDDFKNIQSNRITISNFPNDTNEYLLYLEEDSFRITKNGLESIYNYINTRVTFLGFYSDIDITLRFNKDLKTLSIGGGSEVIDRIYFTGKECFGLMLKDSNGKIKLEKSINGDDIGKNFGAGLNNKPFEYNDILTLKSLDINKVFLSDYIDYKNKIKFSGITEDFKITENGLEKMYNFLSNEILCYNENDKIAAIIRFNMDLKKLSVGSTLEIVNRNSTGEEYFKFTLKDTTGKIKIESSLVGDTHAYDSFSPTLNNQNFEYNDIITLKCKYIRTIVISNYPNLGDRYNPSKNTESFVITDKGLVIQ